MTGALVQSSKLTLASDNTKIDKIAERTAFRDTDSQLHEVHRAGYGLTFRICLPDNDVASWLYDILIIDVPWKRD